MFFVFLDHNFPSGSQEECWLLSQLHTNKVSVPALDEPAHHRTLFWAFGGVWHFAQRYLSSAPNAYSHLFWRQYVFQFFGPCPWYHEPPRPPLPSFVPHRLTSTSLIFLFCCCFSVIVRGLQQKHNLDVVKLKKKLKFSRQQQQSSPAALVGEQPIQSGESPEMVPCVSLFGHVTAV